MYATSVKDKSLVSVIGAQIKYGYGGEAPVGRIRKLRGRSSGHESIRLRWDLR